MYHVSCDVIRCVISSMYDVQGRAYATRLGCIMSRLHTPHAQGRAITHILASLLTTWTVFWQEDAASSVVFSVWNHPEVHAFLPSSGPAQGNTTIAFSGRNFRDTSPRGELRCRFGGLQLPASFTSEGEVRCASPPAAEAGAAGELSVDLSGDSPLDSAADALEARLTRRGVLLLGAAGGPSLI